ncbi:MAG: GbsR/MarR family transcriptional regulator [Myxococcota bacterium]
MKPASHPELSESRARAINLVAETMGELVEFWGFKGSMGRIWSTLYLSVDPLSADQIANLTGLSTGAVSMGMHDLDQWGLIRRIPVPGERKRYYAAHTDVWEVIRRIFRERELRLIGRAVERFEEALALFEAEAKADPDDAELPFIIDRVKGLLTLAKTGYKLVERFADVGDFTLAPIRGTLSRFFLGRGA